MKRYAFQDSASLIIPVKGFLKHLEKDETTFSRSLAVLHTQNDDETALENSKEGSRKPKLSTRKLTKPAIIRKGKESIRTHNQVQQWMLTRRLSVSQTTLDRIS